MISDDTTWNRLAAYVAGETDADESQRLAAWIATTPEAEVAVAELRQLWAVAKTEVPAPDVEAALAQLRFAAAADLEARHGTNRARREAVAGGMGYGVRRALLAASVAVVAFGGWWLARRTEGGASTPVPTAIATRNYTTERGQRLRFTLPDGSSVLLGPQSDLQLAADYGTSSRIVRLTGEAYFTVTHDAKRPFEVRTSYAVARDLGTQFVVRARPTESRMRVVVREGQVALGSTRANEVILDPTDMGEVQSTGEVRRETGIDLSRWLAWTEGRLVFNQTRLDTVVDELERWYGIDIELADPELGRKTFTGTFGEETVVQVLEVVRASLGLTLDRDGARFVLRAS